MPTAARCGPPKNALPRERRVCYRKPEPRAVLSSRKTDLDQIVDVPGPASSDTVRCGAAAPPRIANLGLDPGSVIADVIEQVAPLAGASGAAVDARRCPTRSARGRNRRQTHNALGHPAPRPIGPVTNG
ncbi:hypothetical protein [Burkholderia diffusa]|uniref:hypothetical protein n=1 Tax=Burkholderia diffusa TaxID=488732 RepID=UPI0012D9333E|nr:hypothetical protein [Burkholderia diffusa]